MFNYSCSLWRAGGKASLEVFVEFRGREPSPDLLQLSSTWSEMDRWLPSYFKGYFVAVDRFAGNLTWYLLIVSEVLLFLSLLSNGGMLCCHVFLDRLLVTIFYDSLLS